MTNISRLEKYEGFKELKFSTGDFFNGYPEIIIKKEHNDKDSDYLSLTYFPIMNEVKE
jgi:hypothetical protein